MSFSSIHDHAEDEDNKDDYLKDAGDDYDVYDDDGDSDDEW